MEKNPDEQKPHEQKSTQSSGAANGNSSQDDEAPREEFCNSIPPGNRFVPTDEELVEEYLMKKVNNETLPRNLIPEVNLYSKDPNQLTRKYRSITETERYFFTPRDKKYPNGSRPNRATPGGYWKPTGTDKPIPSGSAHPVAYKKTLDFYLGKHPAGTKTDWKMHEYVLKDTNINNSKNNKKRKADMTLDDWVLCRIYNKKKEMNGGDESSDGGTQAPTVQIAQNNEASFMVGNNNEFEDQNWNASQPTVNVSQNNGASLMAGNSNIAFENQNSNAYQPTVIAAQNNEASAMAGNHEFGFEDQNLDASQPTPNQEPMHEVRGTLQSYLMVGQHIFQNQMDQQYDISEYFDPAAFDEKK